VQLQLIDLDGIGRAQPELMRRCATRVHDFRAWGPQLRLSCRFGTYRRFEAALAQSIESARSDSPALTFYGSGDFHHISLALVRRILTPFNLLVIDKHPDWMRGVPVMHCGTWLYHAARPPHVRGIFHVGGELDFDNAYRLLAPWPDLAEGKIKVLPATRRFNKGKWSSVRHEPLRSRPNELATVERVRGLLNNDRDDLARWPLYVSLDKDVLTASEAIVNWDSGLLTTPEVEAVLQAFHEAAGGNLAGMDVVGDWSPVHVQGLFRRALHWTEHQSLIIDPAEAAAKNESLNLHLGQFMAALGKSARSQLLSDSQNNHLQGRVA
jgi:hypothetical protein